MKLKQQPDDFHVEELTDVRPAAPGAFAFYRLEKRGWTTIDAVQLIRRRWQLEGPRIAYGGLKDRHSYTIQYVTIFHGPRRGPTDPGLALHYLRSIPQALSIRGIPT